MFELNEEHTSFIMDYGLYYYKVMTFGLKNAGATYQRLVNMMFKDLDKTIKVYMDDMLVNSRVKSSRRSHVSPGGNVHCLREVQDEAQPTQMHLCSGFRKVLGVHGDLKGNQGFT